MDGHHLILGALDDFITGERLPDTHDERYRQKIARFLVNDKGYAITDIRPRNPLTVSAGSRKGRLWVDFLVTLDARAAMVIKYGPGSLVTRHRPTLAMSRLMAPYQILVAVVTNGESADVLDGGSGKLTASGIGRIPARDVLATRLATAEVIPISASRAEMEARIVYAYEIDGGCPCDDSVCRIE
jgi:hypothetical protein